MPSAVTLPVVPDDRLQLQCLRTGIRLNTRLIGIEQDRYLIAALPPPEQLDPACDLLQVNRGIIVRYIHEGVAYAFESTIGGFMLSPARLLFLRYPQHVENHELRSYPRVECYLPANLSVKQHLLKGPVTDLSRNGCAIVIEKTGRRLAQCCR